MKLTLCFLADIQPEIFFSLLEKPNSVLPFKFILTEYIEQISQWLIRATISGKTSRTSFPWRSEIKLVKMLPWLLINYPLKRRLFISYFLVKWKFFGNRFCLHRAVPRIFCLRGQTPQTFTGISRIQTGFLVKHYVRKKSFPGGDNCPPPPAPTAMHGPVSRWSWSRPLIINDMGSWQRQFEFSDSRQNIGNKAEWLGSPGNIKGANKDAKI